MIETYLNALWTVLLELSPALLLGLLLAGVLRVGAVEWCLLLLAITLVLVAEMFNTAIEHLAKAITDEHHPRVGTALDIGSAAVLVASLGAVAIGAMVFGHRAGSAFLWW